MEPGQARVDDRCIRVVDRRFAQADHVTFFPHFPSSRLVQTPTHKSFRFCLWRLGTQTLPERLVCVDSTVFSVYFSGFFGLGQPELTHTVLLYCTCRRTNRTPTLPEFATHDLVVNAMA